MREVNIMNATQMVSRDRAILINRATTSMAVLLALASYFWHPVRVIEFLFDIVFRGYMHFVCGSMAHEAVHGHLGKTKISNLWWGRVALLPTATPFVTLQKTHLQHHAATNIPGRDPDEFLNTRRWWEIPFRALWLPSHWVLWLWKRRRLTRKDVIEYVLTGVAQLCTLGLIGSVMGSHRVLTGLLTSATLHSLILWYSFAIKTHEGYFTGAAETRSHDYYGRLLYRISFGLSMHRLHHMQPRLAWTQMAAHVPIGTFVQRITFRRDIRNA
jgi:fatty acid desaturase